MIKIYKIIKYTISAFRLIPVYIAQISTSDCNKKKIQTDLHQWAQWKEIHSYSSFVIFVLLMTDYKAFRNVFYNRIGKV